jgi:hypothetical protein
VTSEGVSDPPRRRSDRRLDRLSGNSGLGVRKRSDWLSEITGMRTEEFARGDPFVVHGVVRRWYVREWNEALGEP